jgi:hypothetical protein
MMDRPITSVRPAVNGRLIKILRSLRGRFKVSHYLSTDLPDLPD